ncbi:hypothetical protein CGZ60_10630, partial [Neisseria animalis]
ADLPDTATEDEKAAAQQAVEDAQNAINQAGNKVATAQNVADAINNSGWNVTSGKDGSGVVSGTSNELVQPGETVTFRAGDNLTLVQDGQTFTFSVNAQNTVENAQLPVVYTDDKGNKVTLIDGNFYPEGTTLNEEGKPVDADGNEVKPLNKGDIIASMNNGDDSTAKPMVLRNVGSNLTPTFNKDAVTPNGDTTEGAAPVTKEAKLPDNVNNIINNAATVGDIL